jgi:hypothetical protein
MTPKRLDKVASFFVFAADPTSLEILMKSRKKALHVSEISPRQSALRQKQTKVKKNAKMLSISINFPLLISLHDLKLETEKTKKEFSCLKVFVCFPLEITLRKLCFSFVQTSQF